MKNISRETNCETKPDFWNMDAERFLTYSDKHPKDVHLREFLKSVSRKPLFVYDLAYKGGICSG